MKKTKFTKLFVLILSLALLIGSAIGIAASADETDTTYSIKSMNIAHGDRTQVLIAVDAVGVDAAEIEVTYTLAGETYVASFYDYVDIYNNDIEYPVFYTKGIPAKDCGQDVLAEAHVAGTTPASPKYMNVSVAGYLYDRLYKAGYIFVTEGEALEKKNLYLAFIDYISAAEEVLWNYNNPGNERVLTNTKTYVYAEDGYVAGTTGSAGYVSGTANLTYTGAAKGQIGWYVETVSGLELVFGNIITLTESAKITPFINENIMTFEDATLGAGLFSEWVGEKDITDSKGKPAYSKSTTTVADIDKMGGITPKYTPNEDITLGRIATGGTHVLIKGSDTNKYLSYKAVPRTEYSGYTGNRSEPPGFNIPVTTIDDNANVTVWSFDAIFDDSCSGPAQIMFSGASGNSIYPFIRGKDGMILIQSSGGAETLATVNTNTYVNVRYEYYWGEGVTQVYVNGVYCGSSTAKYSTHGLTTNIAFNMDGSSAMGALIDNMSAINIYKKFVAEPAVSTGVVAYEDFSSSYFTKHVEWVCTHDTYKNEIAAGKFTYGASTEGYSEDTVFTADNMYYANGVSVAYGVDSKVHNPTASIVTEANGNKYLSLTSPARISDRDRAYSIVSKPNITSGQTTYVYDFDVRPVRGTFSCILYTTANNHAQFTVGTVNNVFAIGGVQIGNYGEWISLRFVIDTTNATCSLYKKGADGAYTFLANEFTISGGSIANFNTTLRDFSMQPSANSAVDYDNVAFYTVGEGFDPTK